MKALFNFFIANPENDFQPGVLNPKFVFVFALALIMTRLLSVSSETVATAVESSALMSLINNERSQRNLPTLLTHSSLITAATQKSQDMIDRDYFAHQDPDGNYVWGKITNAGYTPYKILGENLAIDFNTSEGLVQAWIDSPTHRENLLHPDFVHQGLAALYGDYQGRFTNLTTSLFGTLAIALAPTPEPPPPPPPAEAPKSEPKVEPVQTEEQLIPEPLPPEPEEVEPISAKEEPLIAEKNEPEPLHETPDPATTTPFGPDQSSGREANGQINIVRLVFTIFGLGFLLVLIVDSLIIYRQEHRVKRAHPSYHLFIFLLLVLVSLLVWWWS